MMEVARKIIVVLAGISLAIAVSILVMINGWGLEPKSWWWIIGGNTIGIIAAQLLVKIGLSDE